MSSQMLVGKKINLSRGFSEAKTPTENQKELLFSWQEKIEQLEANLEVSTSLLAASKNAIERKNIKYVKGQINSELNDMRTKARRISHHTLLMDRLYMMCGEDMLLKAIALASEDKRAILSSISIDESLKPVDSKFAHILGELKH